MSLKNETYGAALEGRTSCCLKNKILYKKIKKKNSRANSWLFVVIPLGRLFDYHKNRWLDSVRVQDAVFIFDQLIQCLLENVT